MDRIDWGDIPKATFLTVEERNKINELVNNFNYLLDRVEMLEALEDNHD